VETRGRKEEDVVELNNEERHVSKKKKLLGKNLATRTRSATKAGGGETSTFTLEDNPVDFIIRDLEKVWSRIAEYELQMQQVEEEDQVEDIMAFTAPPVSATKVVVPNATPVSSNVGKGNPGWLPRGRGNTTEPSPDIPCGCQGTAATCTTCAGLCGD
jgi:hypothetical protein